MSKQNNELIGKFVSSYRFAQDALNNDDSEGATQGYKDMLSIYNKIAASNLEPLHKEVAYDQLLKVYQGLQQPKRSVHATTHIIAAAVLLVLFSFLVFFKPTVLGLTTLEPYTVHELNWAFVESESRAVQLDAIPQSLGLTGKVDGDGFVRVYAVTPTSRVLLFDNDFVRLNEDGSFTSACLTTCKESGLNSPDFTLDVIVENAALTLYAIEYT